MKKKIKLWLYGDFETTVPRLESKNYLNKSNEENPHKYNNYKELLKSGESIDMPEVYSWAVGHSRNEPEIDITGYEDIIKVRDYNEEYRAYVGITIESFLILCLSLKYESTMMFNNLKNFDGSYILAGLNRNNFLPLTPLEDLSKLMKHPEDIMSLTRLQNQVNQRIKDKIRIILDSTEDEDLLFLYNHNKDALMKEVKKR